MQTLIETTKAFAQLDALLIQGETGTGKDPIAKSQSHNAGPRKAHLFIAINYCGATC